MSLSRVVELHRDLTFFSSFCFSFIFSFSFSCFGLGFALSFAAVGVWDFLIGSGWITHPGGVPHPEVGCPFASVLHGAGTVEAHLFGGAIGLLAVEQHGLRPLRPRCQPRCALRNKLLLPTALLEECQVSLLTRNSLGLVDVTDTLRRAKNVRKRIEWNDIMLVS